MACERTTNNDAQCLIWSQTMKLEAARLLGLSKCSRLDAQHKRRSNRALTDLDGDVVRSSSRDSSWLIVAC